jgi:hypothetical protein
MDKEFRCRYCLEFTPTEELIHLDTFNVQTCKDCYESLFNLQPSDDLEISEDHFTYRIEKTNMRDIRTANSIDEVRDFYKDLAHWRKDTTKWTFSRDNVGRYHEDQIDEAEADAIQAYWEEECDKTNLDETKALPTKKWKVEELKRLEREEREIASQKERLKKIKV